MYKSVLHELLQLENKDGAQIHLNLLMSSYLLMLSLTIIIPKCVYFVGFDFGNKTNTNFQIPF